MALENWWQVFLTRSCKGIVKTWPKDAVTLSCLRKCYGWSMLVIIYAQSGFPLFVYAADFGSRLDVWASWEAYKKDIKIPGTLHTIVYRTDLLLYNPWEWFRLLLDIFMNVFSTILSSLSLCYCVWVNRSRSAPKDCVQPSLLHSLDRTKQIIFRILYLLCLSSLGSIHEWVLSTKL